MSGEMLDPIEHGKNRLMVELQTILGSRTSYESAVMVADFPNFDVDLPLQAPVVVLSGGRFRAGSTGLGDVLALVNGAAVKGVVVEARFDVDVFTSRGSDEKPSPSGGRNVCERILGLLFMDIHIRRDLIPGWVQDWKMERGEVFEYERDETFDLFNARGTLDVDYEFRLDWTT